MGVSWLLAAGGGECSRVWPMIPILDGGCRPGEEPDFKGGVSQISVVRWGACLQKLHISARSTSKAPHRSGAWEHPSLGSTGVVARADSLVFLWEII
jgi:hypothetical protein